MSRRRYVVMAVVFSAVVAIATPIAYFFGLNRGEAPTAAEPPILSSNDTLAPDFADLIPPPPPVGMINAVPCDPLADASALDGPGAPPCTPPHNAAIAAGAGMKSARRTAMKTPPVPTRAGALSEAMISAVAAPGGGLGRNGPTAAPSTGATPSGGPLLGAPTTTPGGGLPNVLTPGFAATGPAGDAPSDGPTAPPRPPIFPEGPEGPPAEPPFDPPFEPPPPDAVVPVPGAVVLFAPGLAALFMASRRKKGARR